MNKEQQDLAWACLPKEAREEIKNDYKSHPSAYHPYFNEGYEEALKIYFGKHNLTSDTEPSEFICVERVKVDALQSEIFKEIMDAHDAEDWQSIAHYILDVLPRSFHAIFGDKCLPDKEPSVQGESKFKVGDKVRVLGGLAQKDMEGKMAFVTRLPKGNCNQFVVTFENGLWAELPEKYLEPYYEPETKDMEEKELNLCELFAHDDMSDQENIENKNDALVMCMAFAGHILETHCIVEKDVIKALYSKMELDGNHVDRDNDWVTLRIRCRLK